MKIEFVDAYFPFTHPSFEIEVISNQVELELLGAGLVHPQVLRNGGYDPEKVRGIAVGMGIERIVLLRHQIDDIRNFFQNDLRFLSQFS